MYEELSEIKEDLDDLKKTVRDIVLPMIQMLEGHTYTHRASGLGIPRAIMPYIDYLGALYCGYKAQPKAKKNHQLLQLINPQEIVSIIF